MSNVLVSYTYEPVNKSFFYREQFPISSCFHLCFDCYNFYSFLYSSICRFRYWFELTYDIKQRQIAWQHFFYKKCFKKVDQKYCNFCLYPHSFKVSLVNRWKLLVPYYIVLYTMFCTLILYSSQAYYASILQFLIQNFFQSKYPTLSYPQCI